MGGRSLQGTLAGPGPGPGTAWFVAALGLISTTGGQVTGIFTARLATHVLLVPARTGPSPAAWPYPPDVEQRLRSLHGVRQAGVFWPLALRGSADITRLPVAGGGPAAGSPGPQAPRTDPAVAATPGFLAAAGVMVSQGRLFDSWDQAHAARVCLVGASTARSLGIAVLGPRTAVYINSVRCSVIGIIGQAARRPSLLRSVVLPSAAAIAVFGPPEPSARSVPAVLIQVRPGAATVVARQAPLAVSPQRPGRYEVRVPASPATAPDAAPRAEEAHNRPGDLRRLRRRLFLAAGAAAIPSGNPRRDRLPGDRQSSGRALRRASQGAGARRPELSLRALQLPLGHGGSRLHLRRDE